MRPGSGLMKRALWQTIFLLIAVLGPSLTLASIARASAASSGRVPSGPFAADSSPSVPATSEIGLRLGFTMADFTGDTHPDLATVELNGFDSLNALYVIDVQFSEGGRQFLQMKAPFGGLLIAANDVRGDGSLDLVIRAARSGIPVTIFLNDGHGHFTAAEPSAFSNILPDTTPGEKLGTERFYFSATLVSRRSNTIRCQSTATRNPEAQKVSLVSANHRVPLHPFLPFCLDRAPPATA